MSPGMADGSRQGGTVMEKMLIVSADGHAGAPPEAYFDYIEEEYREDLEALVEIDRAWRDTTPTQRRYSDETLDLLDRGGAIRGGGEFGAYELDRRLKELDREGVAAEVLIPGHQVAMLPFFGVINHPYPAGHRAAGARAYHRQLADILAEADGRLYGVGDPGPCLDMDAVVQELHWLGNHGFVGVAPPGAVADPALPPLVDRSYEPFWSACAETGLALIVHAGYGLGQYGKEQGEMLAMMVGQVGVEETLRAQFTSEVSIDQFPEDSPVRAALTVPRRIFWQLMLAGVFDRHPALKLVLTEVRADWIPATLDLLDRQLPPGEHGLSMSPSDYWHRHVYVTPSSPRTYEIDMRHQIGLDRLMFGMDYPHPEGTWPNTREWIQHTFAGVPEDQARQILGLNAIECYGLDKDHLVSIADKIGMLPDELLGGHEVDTRVVASFHDRSGYLRPQEVVDPNLYGRMLKADVDAVAARS
jgi:predicted TIM-barrel fold metal-dependent hydrolase